MLTAASFRVLSIGLILVSLCWLAPVTGTDEEKPADKPKPGDKAKEIAGKSEFLRSVPKHFAILKAVDPLRQRVTLLIEGENLPKVWQLTADVEIKVMGWWGRLDQFQTGDRIWAWFETNRDKHPIGIFMLCDEISEQDMHGPGVKVTANDGTGLTFLDAKERARTISAGKVQVFKNADKAATSTPARLEDVRAGDWVYVQTTGATARLLLDNTAFEARRTEQKAFLRQRWAKDGLPGSVTFLHRLTGEMELMLDHEAMRWTRSLKAGNQVTLSATPPINAVVRHVKAWRERTQVRLVVVTFDQADLTLGQRVQLKMPAPAADVENAALPPDLDRPRTRDERIEWFLASIYCTCKVGGDGCTGHFYTLASCNPNACGMPNMVRKTLAEKIAKGLTDRQIYEELLNEKGPALVKPHLLP